MDNYLIEILKEHKRGKSVGIYSVCSSNQFVLEAAMLQAKQENTSLLIECSANQVNQFGGYSGMDPDGFMSFVKECCGRIEFPFEMILFGGDHLGPNLWQDRPADQAMAFAADLVKSYVQAGFTKIHLDASARCLDDPGETSKSLSPDIIADRTARLCKLAEEFADDKVPPPLYVIGTDVSAPRGFHPSSNEIKPTLLTDLHVTIDINRKIFLKYGLQNAWDRVIAVVVQPGIEFNDTIIQQYRRENADELKKYIEKYEFLVFEANRTDYQNPDSLKQLVEDHFAILKVGPALTFAFREVIFALAWIEKRLLPFNRTISGSNILEIIESVMKANPKHWKRYYPGNEARQAFSRIFSLYDRIRYYWQRPELRIALEKLFYNLSEVDIPLSLVSQYLPEQYDALTTGEIEYTLSDLIYHRILKVLKNYSSATNVKEVRIFKQLLEEFH
jgi:D-tagatose-1,6-bisphosphate aldolase subunit GatZ/KbaZ